jgi:hypothetical protein
MNSESEKKKLMVVQEGKPTMTQSTSNTYTQSEQNMILTFFKQVSQGNIPSILILVGVIVVLIIIILGIVHLFSSPRVILSGGYLNYDTYTPQFMRDLLK